MTEQEKPIEVGMVEANAEPETSASGSMILLQRPQVKRVALKRAIGAGIDAISIGLVALTPCLYRLLIQKPLPTQPLRAILSDNATFFCFCLALSPLPLIYLRLVFRKLLRIPTPGEMFAGVTTITLLPGLTGIIQEIAYATSQYFTVAISAMLGLLIVALSSCFGLLGGNFSPQEIAAFLTLPVITLLLVSLGYRPRSEHDYQSMIDDQTGVMVKRLR